MRAKGKGGVMQMKSAEKRQAQECQHRPRPGGETLRYRTYSHERSTHNVWSVVFREYFLVSMCGVQSTV